MTEGDEPAGVDRHSGVKPEPLHASAVPSTDAERAGESGSEAESEIRGSIMSRAPSSEIIRLAESVGAHNYHPLPVV
ncbi:MAG: hypothetical protein JXA90_08795, partial [Planctomycetes bacterium]|nr:hypothetical protein [Planctomycetota bacterium]